ncbi:hypothetical protein [Brevundimonas sp.]|uniref:hypothetical protein n=1 Tax=Brevundimonas sp. TaxID=1871086 RepID=UPI003566AB6D
MSGDDCRAAWAIAAPHNKAGALDLAFPQCFCEPWSLVGDDHRGVADEEVVARILTTPGMYDAGLILTQKLTSVSAGGASLIRAGASDVEILGTIMNLLQNAAEPQTLLGAAIFSAGNVRSLGQPQKNFGVYHTPDGAKNHHVDLLATTLAGSKTAQKKTERDRRYQLRDFMMPTIVAANDPDELLAALGSGPIKGIHTVVAI